MNVPNLLHITVSASLAVLLAGCVAHHARPDLADRTGRRGDELVRHAAAVCSAARPEKPDFAFTSDGCSMWPDGWDYPASSRWAW